MRKYNFPTLLQVYSRSTTFQKKEENDIVLTEDKIKIGKTIKRTTTSKGLFSRKEHSNLEASNEEYYFNDIIHVKIINIWFQFLFCFFLCCLFISIYGCFDIHNKANILNLQHNLYSILNFTIAFIIAMALVKLMVFIMALPDKRIEIYFNDNKKIKFDYYKFNKIDAHEFIEDLRYHNVKIKNINKRNNIIITILILIGIFFLNIKYKEFSIENRLITSLMDNTCYTNVTLEKGKFIGTHNNENIYILEKTGEKIEFEENIKRTDNNIYNIFILKYFSKDNNDLIATRYVSAIQNNYDVDYFQKYNKEYYYEQASKKFYEFNIPDFKLTSDRNYFKCKVDFYNANIQNSKKVDKDILNNVYSFVNSNQEEQNFNSGKYKQFIKVGKYESIYGTCHVIRTIKLGEYKPAGDDYIAFIDNKEGNHSGIILTYREDLYENKNNYIDYFKLLIPES